MNKREWEQVMPKVPDCVHEAVLDTLEHLEECRENKRTTYRKKSFTKRKAAALVAAMVAVLGTTAMVVAEELWWNQKAAEAFDNPAPELQEQMSERGIAEEQTASVTENGITVTAVQTIKDSNRIYMLFHITSEEAVIDGNSGFDTWNMMTGEGENLLTGYCNSSGGGMLTDTGIGTLKTEGFYYWDILLEEGSEWNGDSLAVSLSDFTYYTYGNQTDTADAHLHRIEGNWELNLHFTDAAEMSRTFDLNQEILISGVPVKICSVTLTPLTLSVHYDLDSVRELKEAVYAGKEDVFLQELFPAGLVDEGGNRIEQGYGATTGYQTAEEEVLTVGLSTVVDVESVYGVLLGEEEIQVDLR